MFAITGITGQVGSAAGASLLARGERVRAIVREEAKGASWRERSADVAFATVEDAASLARAFSGTEGVFVLLPPNFAPSPGFPEARRQIAALKEALIAARPPKVVVLSTVGAQHDHDIGILHALWLLERELGTLPIPVAFLRAAWFMENAAWDVDAARRTGTIDSYLAPLDHRIPMIATADVGATVAELLLETWTGKRVVELEARERYSANDLAAGLGQALGRPVRAQAVPREAWAERFRAQGSAWPEPRMQMLDGFNSGFIDFEPGGTERRRGPTPFARVATHLVG